MSTTPETAETTSDCAASRPTAPPRRRVQAVWWVIAVSLAVIALQLTLRPGTLDMPAVLAQSATSAGAGGVFAFSGQLSKGSYGVFMVDVDTGTIWAYEYVSGKRCLRLAAARSWRFDRYLENFNTCDLPPAAVEQMVDEQRRERLQFMESDVP